MPHSTMEECRVVAAGMARFRDPDVVEELIRRLHAALQCDASILLERTDPDAAVCGFGVGADAMLRSLSQPRAIKEALRNFACSLHQDYRDVPQADPILLGWGARSVAILPVGRNIGDDAENSGAALLLLWRTPDRLSPDFEDCIAPVWALLQAHFPQERSLRQLDEARERLSGILETIPQAVAFVDDDGERGWINPQAAKLLGLPPGAVQPARFSAAMRQLRSTASNKQEIRQTGKQLLRDPKTAFRDWIWELPEPWRVLSVSSRITRERNAEGRIWIFDDVTAKRAMDDALVRSQRFSDRILATTPDITYIYDLVRNAIIYVNGQLGPVLGFSPEIHGTANILGHPCHPEDLPRLMHHYLQCATAVEGEVLEIEYRARHADGSWRWLMSRESRFQADETGRVTQVLGVATDITRRMAAEASLREQEQRWQLALDGTNDGIWDWNAVTGEVFYSSRWKAMLGYAADELPDTAHVWEQLLHPDDLTRAKALVEGHLNHHTPVYVAEYRIRHRDGHYLWVLARGKAIWDETGSPLRMVGSHADITERKEAEAKLTYQASHDALTGLPNRRYFLTLMQAALDFARAKSQPVTLCVCDIDFFKKVNDTNGHAVGDEVLVAFARALREGVRRTDIVGRMGGDEFYVLLPRTPISDGAIILDRIRARWANTPFALAEGAAFSVTSTFGAAELQRGMAAKSLIEAADRALYRAKQKGRNCVEAPAA